ncbi:hypothetical protein [Dyadobacter fermentans]|uniref:hypothetical protein n=1 Tax=Dyadobacter fermentans TaxID=94254 RepID=UPI001C9DB675|nr:hypothetical protein [Dyadobacter fermentans]
MKGIEEREFSLDAIPNKPNILVAPNGFGKSSFAIAFNSLRSNRIELDENNYYLGKSENRPSLSISLTDGRILIADDNQNTIGDVFDVFVINNQTEPKSVVQSFGGRSFAKTSLDIVTTVLVNTIPERIGFDYSSANMKRAFGLNGNRVLLNIGELFSSANLLNEIVAKIDFSRFGLVNNSRTIAHGVTSINEQTGTGSDIKQWIERELLPSFRALEELTKLANVIATYNFSIISDEVDLYLSAWQIIQVKDSMGGRFKKAVKYLDYLREKDQLTQTISSFNPVGDRFDLSPKEVRNKLTIKWPKAHEVSNGQRDILTFIALLLKSRRDFKKDNCILIIDEIFDYLDDANLIAFQYYISTFIDEMKRAKRRIFPILLTHLDPKFFNHFCFNDNRIKVCYLKEVRLRPNKEILKIIYKREDPKVKIDLDLYYFHYHPNFDDVNLLAEFTALKLNTDWATPSNFWKKIAREVRRYLLEDSPFDPISVCFGARVRIEKLVYDKIESDEFKEIFLNEKRGTKEKLRYAESINVVLPEIYFLLGIVYNTSLHLTEGQDVSQSLGLRLENSTIKEMISNIFKDV